IMLNQVLLMGRLAADPEKKEYGTEGGILTIFRLAVERDFKNKNGEKETDFITCKAFGSCGKFASQYYHKGDLVVVSGRWTVEKYTKDDTTNYNHVLTVKETYPAHLKQRRDADGATGPGEADLGAPEDMNMPFR
ncbi:MAG: single-stranded DNA-binding protein, partial [Agathobacter sp.]|nr:single-stranded DNA-binding protein [Agathobacter sp.]